MADRVIKAALLGLGTVGGGVYKVLKMQEEEMIPKLGAKVELKKILVRNIEKASKTVTHSNITYAKGIFRARCGNGSTQERSATAVR